MTYSANNSLLPTASFVMTNDQSFTNGQKAFYDRVMFVITAKEDGFFLLEKKQNRVTPS